MKKAGRKFGLSLAVAVALAIGCRDADRGTPTEQADACHGGFGVCAIIVEPATAQLRVGDTLRFVATLPASIPQTLPITWTSSDQAKVDVAASGVARGVSEADSVRVCARTTFGAQQLTSCARAIVVR